MLFNEWIKSRFSRPYVTSSLYISMKGFKIWPPWFSQSLWWNELFVCIHLELCFESWSCGLPSVSSHQSTLVTSELTLEDCTFHTLTHLHLHYIYILLFWYHAPIVNFRMSTIECFNTQINHLRGSVFQYTTVRHSAAYNIMSCFWSTEMWNPEMWNPAVTRWNR